MIIPVKCFGCGEVLADKYRYFVRETVKRKMAKGMDSTKVVYLTKQQVDKTPEAEILDELKLTKQCCRRHMLTHVDIE